jgi:hypothetical protein
MNVLELEAFLLSLANSIGIIAVLLELVAMTNRREIQDNELIVAMKVKKADKDSKHVNNCRRGR